MGGGVPHHGSRKILFIYNSSREVNSVVYTSRIVTDKVRLTFVTSLLSVLCVNKLQWIELSSISVLLTLNNVFRGKQTCRQEDHIKKKLHKTLMIDGYHEEHEIMWTENGSETMFASQFVK